MARYDGSVRLHVSGSTQREVLPSAVIDDVTSASWQIASVSGELEPGADRVDALVELMDGDHAGWTARATVTGDGSSLRIEGSEAFMPGT